jgi:hypothetical protein
MAQQNRRFIFAPREVAIRDDSWGQNFVDGPTENILCDVTGTCNLDFEIDPIVHPRVNNLSQRTISGHKQRAIGITRCRNTTNEG